MQCGYCGQYRQVGFQNQDDLIAHSYRQLMQERIPFVRVARDLFISIRSGTVRVTSRTATNPIGRVNLDGHDLHNGDGLAIYDQEEETWRDGRIESDTSGWYFTSGDEGHDVMLRQGMLARLNGRGRL